MNQSSSSQNAISFRQHSQTVAWLCEFGSLSTLIFIRKNQGVRYLSFPKILGLFFILYYLGRNPDPVLHSEHLRIFAVMVLVLGLYQKFLAAKAVSKGLHSYYVGDSIFRRLPMPAFMRRHRRCERFVDPIMVFMAGKSISAFFSMSAGSVVCLSAIAIRLYEWFVWRDHVSQELDFQDGLASASILSKHAEQQTNFRAGKPRSTVSESIPSGLGSDIKPQTKTKAKME